MFVAEIRIYNLVKWPNPTQEFRTWADISAEPGIWGYDVTAQPSFHDARASWEEKDKDEEKKVQRCTACTGLNVVPDGLVWHVGLGRIKDDVTNPS